MSSQPSTPMSPSPQVSSSPLPYTPSSSFSIGPAIPKIWRNDSLTRVHLTNTTTTTRTTSSSFELGTFAHNPLGARFSEDIAALSSSASTPPPPQHVCFAGDVDPAHHTNGHFTCPRPPTPNPVNPVNEDPMGKCLVSANSLHALTTSIERLETLREKYVHATRLSNPFARFFQLRDYRALIKGISRLISVAKHLAASSRAHGLVKSNAQMQAAACHSANVVVRELLYKAEKRFEALSMVDVVEWRSPRCRRMVMLGMRDQVGDLAVELGVVIAVVDAMSKKVCGDVQ